MGKANRKVARKQQKKQGDQVFMDTKKMIQLYLSEGSYEQALEKIIELLNKNSYDADILLAAAEAYFMAGDYDRTSTWINTTLDYDAGNIPARILLAKLCMIQERTEDAIKIIEFVLRTGADRLDPLRKEQIEEILDYFKYTEDSGMLKENYPFAAKFMGIVAPDDHALCKNVEQNSVDLSMEQKNVAEDAERMIHQDVQNDDFIDTSDAAKDEMDLKNGSAEEVKAEILQKEISLKEKICLLNSFAGAYYYENRVDEAVDFLYTAESLDRYDEETLQNLIVISLEKNCKEDALLYAGRMKTTKFSLLKKIKEV